MFITHKQNVNELVCNIYNRAVFLVPYKLDVKSQYNKIKGSANIASKRVLNIFLMS